MAVEKNIDLTPEQRELVMHLLNLYLPNTKVWAFGSRVKWTSNPHSDLDLVAFANSEQRDHQVELLREAFEESNLPFRVDLLVWNALPEDFKDVIRKSYFILSLEKKSKITDCSKDNWQLMALGELLQLRYGRGLPKKSRNQKGFIPVYGSNGVIGFHDQAYTENGAIIIGRKGTAGAVHYSKHPCWPIDTTYFIPETEHTDLLRFQYYLLLSLNLENLNSHSAVPGLNRDNVHAQVVFIPPESAQKKIAKILGDLDDKIELNHRMNQTLEEIAQALFKSWFVDFDPVRAKMAGKDTGLPKEIADLFPDRLVDSELGEIPEGWHTSHLDTLVKITKGASYRKMQLAESDTALVTLKSFKRGGGYRSDGLKAFTGKYKPDQKILPGEVIVACTDVTQAGDVVGRAALVQECSEFEKLVASLDVLIVRPIGYRLTKSFLYHLFGTERFVNHAKGYATGTTVLHLSKFALPKYLFSLPTHELVMTFDSIVSPIYDLIKIGFADSKTIMSVKDKLLPKLVSGDISKIDLQ